MAKFPFYQQLESIDCAPTCIRMVAKYFGKRFSTKKIKDYCNLSKQGTSINDLIHACAQIKIKAVALNIGVDQITSMPLPAILFWKQDHYVVLYGQEEKNGKRLYHIADPGFGKITLGTELFEKNYLGNAQKGIALLLAPEEGFDDQPEDHVSLLDELRPMLKLLVDTMRIYKVKFALVTVLTLLSMVCTWVLPMLFQQIIDQGIGNKNFHVVLGLIAAQLLIFIGYGVSNGISNLVSSRTGIKIGLNFQSDYLRKLIKLPISFFDTKLSGDLMQRMNDHEVLRDFFTSGAMQAVFALLNLLVFSGLLLYYNVYAFTAFVFFSLLSSLWAFLFFKQNRILNYRVFSIMAENKDDIYDLVNGMREIKLNNAAQPRLHRWEQVLSRANDTIFSQVKVANYAQIGGDMINKLKDICILGGCALLVIQGKTTIGEMMTISYVVGQASAPFSQLIGISHDVQNAKLSYDRIADIQDKKEEVEGEKTSLAPSLSHGFELKQVSFKYHGTFAPFVLKNINLTIPVGKRTAIVGTSGSGKTTLVKLLLSFYAPQQGQLTIDGIPLQNINPNDWRSHCGVVLQNGTIFNGSITDNIALSDTQPDMDRVIKAAELACIDHFIKKLPMGYNTKIGSSGIDMSGGQKQRLLIARAIYRNPSFFFFDEATNALDTQNERLIIENINKFTQGRTVVIVAHRLSTVKEADQIVVLDQGEIVEVGTHEELTVKQGYYFNLIKNQLELEQALI